MASAFLSATVLGASGGAGIKFFQPGLGEGWLGRTLPAPDSTTGRIVPPRLQGRPGGSALGRCQPWCRPDGLTRAPPPSPSPPPPLARTGPASPAPPAPGSLQSPRPPQAPSPGAPASFQPGQRLGGERRTARVAEARALGVPALPTWETAPTLGAGTRGKARTGRPAEGRAPLISHASHVWGHPAAFFFLSPFAFSPLPCWRGQSGRGGAMPGPE